MVTVMVGNSFARQPSQAVGQRQHLVHRPFFHWHRHQSLERSSTLSWGLLSAPALGILKLDHSVVECGGRSLVRLGSHGVMARNGLTSLRPTQ